MNEVKPPVAFCQLIKDCQRIEVPLIQRDYAQGREAHKDVRNDFLGALHDALVLPADDSKLPLNLDFVYGSKGDGNPPGFLPLDGQQRLTTLFLLHWYMAWRDRRLPDFKSLVWDGKHSRFTYGVRPSSTEFFDALVGFVPTNLPDDVPSVRRMLEDESWFFLHWRSDPTIQAVLTMLDAIHTRFRESKGLYARLVDEARPAITFHLLQLEHFGLSDDLYIKMNARGKPLTAFETFKARFEELLKTLSLSRTREIEGIELPVPAFFERRMDTQWTDFFWNHQNAAFDEAAMNLVWALIRVSLNPASSAFAVDTVALGEKALGAGFTLFHDRGWLTPRFADHLMDLLEAWSAGGGKLNQLLPNTSHFDETLFFQRAITAPWALTYLELVQFAALVMYLTHYPNDKQKDTLREWMRVVTNLAVNSDIERPEEFGRSLAGLHKMVPHGNRILEWFAETEMESLGFSPQQVREEQLKAKLILSHPGWKASIETAEMHGYFRGQIEFLLKYSGVYDRWLNDKSVAWNFSEDSEYQRRFSDYFAKASAVFSADGLMNFGKCRWERALLTKGDYLLERGSNRCFLENGARDANWKRLLRGSYKSDPIPEQKRQYVRELLDEIDVGKGVVPSLDAVLSKPLPDEPWKRAVIEQAEIIDYCSGRNIRWHHTDGNIYLLRGKRMSGDHAELFTYHLKVGLLTAKHEKGELLPFSAPQYTSVSGESSSPYAYIKWQRTGETIFLIILCHKDGYEVRLMKQEGPLPEDVMNIFLRDGGFIRHTDEKLYRTVERAAIDSALDEIIRLAKQSSPAATP